jgi:large subunit ribosomal protein L24
MARRIRKGDVVQVISGDDKGKTGRVLSVLRDRGRVVVEKVNMVRRHTKPRRQGQQGGILEKEAPIHLSNVLLYDDKAGRGARVGVRTLNDGSRERISKASGEVIATKGSS